MKFSGLILVLERIMNGSYWDNNKFVILYVGLPLHLDV